MPPHPGLPNMYCELPLLTEGASGFISPPSRRLHRGRFPDLISASHPLPSPSLPRVEKAQKGVFSAAGDKSGLFLTNLVADGARCLTSRLAGGLAFTTIGILVLLLQYWSNDGLQVFLHRSFPPLLSSPDPAGPGSFSSSLYLITSSEARLASDVEQPSRHPGGEKRPSQESKVKAKPSVVLGVIYTVSVSDAASLLVAGVKVRSKGIPALMSIEMAAFSGPRLMQLELKKHLKISVASKNSSYPYPSSLYILLVTSYAKRPPGLLYHSTFQNGDADQLFSCWSGQGWGGITKKRLPVLTFR